MVTDPPWVRYDGYLWQIIERYPDKWVKLVRYANVLDLEKPVQCHYIVVRCENYKVIP